MPTKPSPKKKFERAEVLKVAKQLCDCLKPFSERLIVAGSMRRRKPRVSDLELLFIPTFKDEQVDLLTVAPVNQFDKMLEFLIKEKIVAKRKNALGSFVFGPKNKLMLHVPTGIPVDFFATDEACYWNMLVMRTGGARNNILIAEAYKRKGLHWHVYGIGYTDRDGNRHRNVTEADVYVNAGLRYLKPWERP